MSFNVPLKRSHIPLACGWYGVVKECFIPIRAIASAITEDMNWGPLSDSTSFGMPSRVNIDTNASAMCSDVVELRATASGHLVA